MEELQRTNNIPKGKLVFDVVRLHANYWVLFSTPFFLESNGEFKKQFQFPNELDWWTLKFK